MTVEEIINLIISKGYEYDILKLLLLYITEKQSTLDKENRHLKATIRTIQKINQGKNSAIDNLCDEN